MAPNSNATVAYRRARFGTRLPVNRLYTRSHYWLERLDDAGLWKIGFTRFATRMLGDIVEFQFDVAPSAAVTLGQRLGWIEGFKAVSDIYSVGSGTFQAANLALNDQIALIESEPYDRGWLFTLAGEPDPDAVDVDGYIAILDATIDKMHAERHNNPTYGDHQE